ncbi:hypothetical protein PA25_22300 [Pseudoalteromonas sp. A25]|uniref:winged helix-turn-helix domain-containing protein n=1 Tax=Pseudoalteromonas sp. A25 TaxID=116092 RepID=UPI0012609513|nr:winged helix-turn-helix domain-containing protein [Pseudoalteromonas sp. A25]BBN82245.1 hypothetical protein PA25_22300 [Pseudoalteromonas sp. A25]
MYLYFEHFRYDVEKQQLYKDDELIPLKRNQAAMLECFLGDQETIHSKDDLLNAVWGDQVVSEQVIFQTISQLRSIFGSKAIKTFSKKGYKWELKTTDAPPKSQADDAIVVTEPAPSQNKVKLKSAIAVCIVLLAIVFTYMLLKTNKSLTKIDLHLLTSDVPEGHSTSVPLIMQAISHSPSFNLYELNKQLSPYQAFASPKHIYAQSGIATDDWLVGGTTYFSEQSAVFQYGLFASHMHWQGYVQADSVNQLTSAVSMRFEQLLKMGLFDANSDSWTHNHVRALLKLYPDDPDLLLLAAQKYEHMQQNDVAMSYLQQLVALPSIKASSPYRAVAHWKMGMIYKMRGQHIQAHNSLAAMSDVLALSPLGPLHFKYIKTKAWLAYSETDHASMYETLKKGFSYFERANANLPLIKFKMHILNSILAQKVSDHETKYHHLSEAQALLLKHKLDESNYALVYYHHALFSQLANTQNSTTSEGVGANDNYVAYLDKILELPRTMDNFWVHDEAIALLVSHYIEQQRFKSAHGVLLNKAATPKRQFLKAKIQLAQGHNANAIQLLESAYQQAKIDYDSRTAIESALLLYQLSNDAPKKRAEYLAYLEVNTKADWLKEQLTLVHGQTAPLSFN